MNARSLALKAVALISAIALGGGYVWWSQERARDRREQVISQEKRVLPGAKSFVFSEELSGKDAPVPLDRDQLDAWLDQRGKEVDERTNADFIAPSSDQRKERTLLPGSKVGLVTPPEPAETKPEPRTVLPGSKSIDRVLQPPATEKEEP